jgi:hypothetical protein
MLLCGAGGSYGQVKSDEKRKDALAEMSQSERKKHIQRLLDSNSPNDQAWGAYWAAQYGMSDFAPNLIRLVNPPQSRNQTESLFRDLAMFDNLIKLNVSVSSEHLLPLYDRYPDQVLILFAKSPKENSEALLEIARKEYGGIYQVTACNLLEKAKAPGFAAYLLNRVFIHVNILVVRKGADALRIIDPAGIRAIRRFDSVPFVSLDLPPIDNYRLTQAANETSLIVAPGIIPIYYKKQVCHPGPRFPEIGKDANDDAERQVSLSPIDYLVDMTKAAASIHMPDRTYYSRAIQWESDRQFSDEISSFCTELHAPYKSVLKRLLATGWLTESEAQKASINVQVEAEDVRDRPPAMLTIPSWCSQITIAQ